MNKKKIKEYSELTELITIILGCFEIPRFKQNKMKIYYHTVKEISIFEIKLAEIREAICLHVLKNMNIPKTMAIQ